DLFNVGVDRDPHGRVGLAREGLTQLECRSHCGDVGLWGAQRSVHDAETIIALYDVALVEHDGPNGPCGCSVVDLDSEVTRAALHERDVARGELGEAFRLASARGGTITREVDVYGLHDP